MDVDLFGKSTDPSDPLRLELFADEIKESVNRETFHRWHYIGVLAVPVQKKAALLNRLLQGRDGCDSEIKSTDLDHSLKRRTAVSWVNALLEDHRDASIYLNIVGIDVSLLNKRAFGGDRFDRIYNRFFRSCILSGCSRFFRRGSITIDRIWHDESDLEHDEYFPWHSIFRMEADRSLVFGDDRIAFVSSDHRGARGCNESHLIQFVDLILGLVKQLLDDTSRKQARCNTARLLVPLLSRMMHAPQNPRSRYGYKDKYLISFFPSRPLTDAELTDPFVRATSQFYDSRPLLQVEREEGQGNLFFPRD